MKDPVGGLLNDPDLIRECDPHRMSRFLEAVDSQLAEALRIGSEAELPRTAAIDNIVLCGMGGSAGGGDFIRSYLGPRLKVPFHVHRNYGLPGFSGKSTLVIVVSYSGETEEALSALDEAHRLECGLICLSSGGEVEVRARRYQCPCLLIPAGIPPRAATAYCAIPPLVVLARMGLAADCAEEIRGTAEWVRGRIESYGIQSPVKSNVAKELAIDLYGKIPLVYGSQDRLDLVAMRWRNQFAENAKQLAFWNALPEMNHNELSGWGGHPQGSMDSMAAVFLRDSDDPPQIQRRFELTRALFGEKGGKAREFWSEGQTWMERLWSLILLGDFASYYLACLNQEDPNSIEVISDLKRRIQKKAEEGL